MKIRQQHFFTLILFVFYCFFLSPNLFAQKENTSFKITSVNLDKAEKVIKAKIKITEEGSKTPVAGRDFSYFEDVGKERNFLGLNRFKKLNGGFSKDTFSILFLIDISGSMKVNDRLEKSKNAIFTTIMTSNFPDNYKFYLSEFDNKIFPSVPINKENIEEELSEIVIRGYPYWDTDLYRAVIEKTNEFKNKPGKKVIVLLSDGENDTKNNPYYKNHDRFEAKDAQSLMKKQKDDFLICPIALGSKADFSFLEHLVMNSPSQEDVYIHSETAEELKDIFLRLVTAIDSDYIIYLNPAEGTIYKGEDRELIIKWNRVKTRDSSKYKAGSTNDPIDFKHSGQSVLKNWFFYLIRGLFGTLFVVLLLVALRYFTPWFQQRQFRTVHVKKYKHTPGTPRAINSLVGEPIEDGEQVVHKCRQTIPLDIWDQLGHCPEYPNCMEYQKPCDGAGAPSSKGNFWSQQGIYKKLNWLWFGGLGGLIGWILFAISQLTFSGAVNNFLKKLFGGSREEAIMAMSGGKEMLNNLDNMSTEILIGVFIGTGLIFSLSLAAERGEDKGISWGKIAIRSFIGLITCTIVFFFGFLLQYLVLNNPYLSGLIIWTIIGFLIGFILSIKSSIETSRGILGGILASIIGYHFYYLIGSLSFDFEFARLFSMIILGMVLGYIIVVVLLTLEDFELVFISPSRFSGTVKPISKWLRKGLEITIGTSQKCHIVIKWEDPSAQDFHARLSYKEGRVYLEPLHEMLLNGVIMPPEVKAELHDNDILKFGLESKTAMQYKEKREFIGKSKKSLISRLFSRNKK